MQKIQILKTSVFMLEITRVYKYMRFVGRISVASDFMNKYRVSKKFLYIRISYNIK
jgi:hypothetical protein